VIAVLVDATKTSSVFNSHDLTCSKIIVLSTPRLLCNKCIDAGTRSERGDDESRTCCDITFTSQISTYRVSS
jgi:hypothetical protein